MGKVHYLLSFTLHILRCLSLPLAIRSIRNYPKKIQSFEEAKAIKGVGEKTAHKVSSSRLVTLKSRTFSFLAP